MIDDQEAIGNVELIGRASIFLRRMRHDEFYLLSILIQQGGKNVDNLHAAERCRGSEGIVWRRL